MILELKTLLIAMTPIGEARVSIPIALEIYHLSVWKAFVFSVIGNMIPVIILLKILSPTSRYFCQKSILFNKFFSWLYKRNKKNHRAKFKYYKELALVILVAIPLPFTGAYTSSICAFIFKIPFKKAFPLILIGVIIASAIVILLTLHLL
ncbi:MAG: small multi-drug export protein [Patescibacteria group bacterium]|nr:small multi-drug export protein [Patescibacteria group bacterium]